MAIVMYVLNKIDLFDRERELRMARIEEVFQARIEEIKTNTENFNKAALETLAEQRNKFDGIKEEFISAFNTSDYDQMSSSMYEMADFMDADVEYSDTEVFESFLDDNETIEI